MIQAFQKFSQSRIAKIFLAIVALSFVAFFGGGDWFRGRDPYAVMAEVGNLSIGRYEFVEKVQAQLQRVLAEAKESTTREELLNAGLPQMVLNQMIQEILLNLETKHLGLTVNDQQVKARIEAIPSFHNENGMFDRILFTQIIRANGLSEDSFIEEVRHELIREQLISSIMIGAFLPQDQLERLFEAQYQYRQASLLIVSPKEMTSPQAPNQETLQAFYNKHQKEFETPELRNLTALIIDPVKLSQNITVTEEDIRSTFETKAESFKGKSLNQVRPLVIAEIKKEKGLEKAYQLSQELDDKVAGGATFEELVSSENGISLFKVEGVDKEGRDKVGSLSSNVSKDKELTAELLQTAFSLEEAMDSQFIQAKTGTYFMVRVDKINPPHIQPLGEIKDHVVSVWKESIKFKEAQARAKDYVKSINEGGKKGLAMTLLPKLSLSEPSPKVSDEVKQVVFSLRPGRAGMAYIPEGFAVIVLKSITPPATKTKTEKMDSFKKIVLKAYQEDLVMAYLNALRIRYPVKINREALKALFSEKN